MPAGLRLAGETDALSGEGVIVRCRRQADCSPRGRAEEFFSPASAWCAPNRRTRETEAASDAPDARQNRVGAAPVGQLPSGTGRESGWGAASRRGQLIDPSFFIRRALPVALADTIVPAFPVVTKSVDQSYAGNDRQLHRAPPARVGETAA